MILQFVVDGLCAGAVFGLIAVGFGLVYRSTRVLHIAHGSIIAVAAYVTYLLNTVLGWPLLCSACAGVVASAALALAADRYVYRPLRQRSASDAVLMVSSLGLNIALSSTLALVAGSDRKFLRSAPDRTWGIATAVVTQVQILQMSALLAVVGFGYLFMRRSRYGRQILAMTEDSELAELLGANVPLLRAITVVAGTAIAVIGMVLSAVETGIAPNAGFAAVVAATTACFVGGMTSVIGPAVGGILLGVTQSLLVWQTSASWSPIATVALLIPFLLLRRHSVFAASRDA